MAGPGDLGGSPPATVAFVDIAGFSAIADVFGDGSALAVLERFEALVRDAIGPDGKVLKWIGDEAMLLFSGPDAALRGLGRLLPACRGELRLPLTRTGVNHGPLVRRGGDVYGATVNVAARIAAAASPGQLLTTRPVADAATARGIEVRALGEVRLRSVAAAVALFEIVLAEAANPAWIDPVCKMHAPWSAFAGSPDGLWFCSPRCQAAWERSPETYRRA